jgi:hypothetical protein
MTPRDPFADLQSALARTPSSDFAARVRARVASAPRRRSLHLEWFTGAALVAAIATFVFVAVRDSSESRPARPDAATAEPRQRTPDTVASAPTVAKPARAIPRAASIGATAPVVAPDPFNEVLVPDDQRVALVRLLAAMQSGKAVVPRVAVTTDDEDSNAGIAPLPDIVPMKIEPLAGTPADAIKREIKKEP